MALYTYFLFCYFSYAIRIPNKNMALIEFEVISSLCFELHNAVLQMIIVDIGGFYGIWWLTVN